MIKQIIGFIILLVFNYIILEFVVDNGNDDNGTYKAQIEKLQKENAILLNANTQLDQEVAYLIDSKDSLTAEIQTNATLRKQIKIERDEKMDDISGMGNNELYDFFSNFRTDSTNGQIRH